MNSVKTVLWDLDGTLLDTLEDLADGVNHALKAFSHPERSLEEIRSFVGNGSRALIACCLPKGLEHPQFEEIHTEFQSYYRNHCQIKTKAFEGVLPLLKRLKDKGLKMSIVSNKPHPAVVKLAADYFDALVENAVGEKPGVPRKPARDMIVNAMAELSASPESTVYVGDSEVDVKTAANAGIPCISVCWGFRDESELKQAGATCICHTMAELEAVLLG